MGPLSSMAESPTRRYRWSSEVPWDLHRRERFQCGVLGFDVRLAKERLQRHPVRVQYEPIDRLAAWVRDPSDPRSGPFAGHVDIEKLPRADPDLPLIFVETPVGGFLVDGHHRLERGRRQGRTEFPVAVLRDPEDGKAISRPFTPRPVHWWVWRPRRRTAPPSSRRPRSEARTPRSDRPD